MKICVVTLGCKVNQYESDALIFKLKELGHDAVGDLEVADAYIINTCAVTNEAERKSRQMIERCRKFNKDAEIYVIGCASQNKCEQFEDRNINFVLGSANKLDIIKHFGEHGHEIEDFTDEYDDSMTSAQTRTRAFIKVQDGCNRFCSYCLIPYVRGRSRSRKIESVVSEINSLPDTVKEVVIVGIDVSSFRDGDKTLIDLLEAVDSCGRRWRLSSMEDNIISEEFILRLKNCKNFCPHFHLSLQSGSDAVLKKMNRKYTTEQFFETTQLIRKHFDFAGITTDVIVGFPTETEENFEETLDFVKKVKFSDLHIFPYSKRNGTAATKLYKDLPKPVKMKRLYRLQEVGNELKNEFILSNKEVEVLVEEEKEGYYTGYSKNYIKCYFMAENVAVGDIVKGKIAGLFKDGALILVK